MMVALAHAAALAHRLQRVASAALFKRVDERGHDAGTAGTQRVTNGYGPTVHVGARQNVGLLPIYVLCPGRHDGLAARTSGSRKLPKSSYGRGDEGANIFALKKFHGERHVEVIRPAGDLPVFADNEGT